MNTRARDSISGLARLGLCTAFIYSGVSKLLDWHSGMAEQQHFGLEPAAFFLVATIAVQLVGSALVLFGSGRAAAVGALLLAGFTLVATLIGHAFWAESGIDRFRDLNSFLEHIGLIGGFVLVAVLELSSPRGQSSPAGSNKDVH